MQLRKRMEMLIDEMLDGQILLGEAVGEFEKLYIERAIAKFGTQVSKTAVALGIHRNTLAKHLAGNGVKNGRSPGKRASKKRPGPSTKTKPVRTRPRRSS
jgi:DNA-binding NtrC family response regulator